MTIIPVFAHLFFQHRQKKVLYRIYPICCSAYLHPGRSPHSRIFVPGGSFFARKVVYKKKAVLGAACGELVALALTLTASQQKRRKKQKNQKEIHVSDLSPFQTFRTNRNQIRWSYFSEQSPHPQKTWNCKSATMLAAASSSGPLCRRLLLLLRRSCCCCAAEELLLRQLLRSSSIAAVRRGFQSWAPGHHLAPQ